MKKIHLTIITATLATLFCSGCTANLTEPEIDFAPPKYVEQMPAKDNDQDFVSTGSVFGQGDNPLFSDHKAMHENDIVKVVISETASSSSSAAKQLSEDDSSALTAGLMVPGANAAGPIGTIAGHVNGVTDMGFSSANMSAYKGAGSAKKDATFSTTITARIIKVLQNGNYFIAGSREILIDEQKQIVQISGVIRPYDIDQYNSINSNQMSDAKILYKTEGDVDRATKQGWGIKLLQAVWPL